ncbi:MAG: 5-deoxy-glucuronate isomerase [Bacteroidota bacterium]
MKRDKKCPILAKSSSGEDIYQHFTYSEAGWNHLNFMAQTLKPGQRWAGNTGNNEYLFVILGGNMSAHTSSGDWITSDARKNVFSGLPHALYLPQHTEFEITPIGSFLDIACGWCVAEQFFQAHFITPADVVNMGIEYRGGDNASRQINRILPPGSNVNRLICVEVYTPSGNWSSFPAHKHDTRKTDPVTGAVTEACLEEIYFYKIDKPQGFAIQKVYNDSRTLDEIAEVHHNDVVLIPEGYHPVVAGHGYNVYYLNFLAGSDQSLASTNDPDHKWIYGTWKGMDPRIPIVTIEMNGK